MAAQGWYPAPGELGMLRYWDGNDWTDHRQPIPPTGAPVATAVASATSTGQPVMSSPALTPQSGYGQPIQTQDAAAAGDPGRLADDLRAFAASPVAKALGEGLVGASMLTNGFGNNPNNGFQFGAGVGGGVGTGFGGLNQPGSLNAAGEFVPSAGVGTYAGAGAYGGAYPNGMGGYGRVRRLGPATTIVIGLVVAVISILFAVFVAGQSRVNAGETTITGVVDNVSQSTNSDGSIDCDPSARYVVDGHTYEANASVGGTCADQVGEDVNVIYSIANPEQGRVVFANPQSGLIWVFPVLGLIIAGIGVWQLIRKRRAQAAQPTSSGQSSV